MSTEVELNDVGVTLHSDASVLRRKTLRSAGALYGEADDFFIQNNYSYDCAVVFPLENENNLPENATMLLKKIMKTGLELKTQVSLDKKGLICLIRAPLNLLQDQADLIDYKMLLDPEQIDKRGKEGGDTWNAFSIPHVEKKTPIYPYEHIYGKYEKSIATADPENNLYFIEPGENHPFRTAHRIKLIVSLLKQNAGISIRDEKRKKNIKAFFPLHNYDRVKELVNSWVWTWKHPWDFNGEPLWDMKNYMGEKIALYFAFLTHYTTWLWIPAVLGIVPTYFYYTSDPNMELPVHGIFGLIICLWGILMLEYWKRAEAEYALKWGMLGFEEEQQDRPEFEPEGEERSIVDGQMEKYYPQWKVTLHKTISWGVISSAIIVVVAAVVAIIIFRLWSESSDHEIFSEHGSSIASFGNSICIMIFNEMYTGIAIKLTEWENPRTDTEYEDSLIAKLFLFKFVNSYAAMINVGFIASEGNCNNKCDDLPEGETGSCCLNLLTTNLAIIFISQFVVGNITEVIVPYIKFVRREAAKDAKGIEDDWVEDQYEQDEYDEVMGTMADYAEIAIQYGYASLFVVAFPLTPLIALFSNYIEIRSDSFKLFKVTQRPVPNGAEDIGTWQTVFSILSIIAVVSNLGLVCFKTTAFIPNFSAEFLARNPQYEYTTKYMVFIGLQYIVFIFMFVIEAIVPDVPHTIDIQSQRTSFITSKLIDNTPDEEEDEITEADISNMHKILPDGIMVSDTIEIMDDKGSALVVQGDEVGLHV